jgi:hypothetical protein
VLFITMALTVEMSYEFITQGFYSLINASSQGIAQGMERIAAMKTVDGAAMGEGFITVMHGK